MSKENTIYKGYRIVIEQDSDPSNPRKEYDNAGRMICFHNRYDLGDKHSFSDPDELFMELANALPDSKNHHPVSELLGDGSEFRIIWEPLYLYDHSGITMSTSPFSCRWDSGQVGIIYMTYDDIMKSVGATQIGDTPWVPSPEQIESCTAMIKGEVETYDQYIRGDVYGFMTYEADESANDSKAEGEDQYTEDDDEYWCEDSEDSCWGFYGEESALEAAKESIDASVDNG